MCLSTALSVIDLINLDKRLEEELSPSLRNYLNQSLIDNSSVIFAHDGRNSSSYPDEYKEYTFQYLVHIWIITILSLATFIKFYYLYKAVLLFLMFGIYSFLIWLLMSWTSGIIILGLFVILVLYHGRQVEIASSLDFLWKQQAKKELEDMNEMRRHTNQLLHNILPTHVAKYFLEREPTIDELYATGRSNAGDVNEGMECIRLLNEIIVDFDEILDDEKFRSIEKIKTIGSTYMAASGINPLESEMDDLSGSTYLWSNWSYAACFDIWGDTVNESSRMDSTGTPGYIQVSKQTALKLSDRGYIVKERGVIKVKGKGEMLTYYVLGRKIHRRRRKPLNQDNNSLAEVVYRMVKVRKRNGRHGKKGKGRRSSTGNCGSTPSPNVASVSGND
ncbi:ADCY8 [Lepeophtheirus salmonis]|uniref:adenylate cyclase n=1 Tax=Lepeophtheirus salmonis TaxID=72036 RepID=A0A7R8CVL0_LEPSM|nr:ADCY8 [Lepeophtheirus salmonis]CAF2945728.1 ADCY8 [Lepeophtheirus salmonis]